MALNLDDNGTPEQELDRLGAHVRIQGLLCF